MMKKYDWAEVKESVEASTLLDPDRYIENLKFELGEVKIGKQLTSQNRQKLIELLIEYQDVVSFSGRLGCTNLMEYQIRY